MLKEGLVTEELGEIGALDIEVGSPELIRCDAVRRMFCWTVISSW